MGFVLYSRTALFTPFLLALAGLVWPGGSEIVFFQLALAAVLFAVVHTLFLLWVR